jgi:hypothetical protein
MTIDQTTYLVFGIVVIISLIFDLGVFSKKSTNVSIRTALYQSLFWVLVSLAFGVFMWWMEGEKAALEYISAYLMEKSLSIDNIFVFILIFSFFGIRKDHVARALIYRYYFSHCISYHFYCSRCSFSRAVSLDLICVWSLPGLYRNKNIYGKAGR